MDLLFLLISVLVLLSVSAVFRHIGRGSFMVHDFNLQRTLPIKGLLAILIVLHHLACVVWNQHIPIVSEFMSWGGLVVSVFFFITGYGLMQSYLQKGRGYLNGFLQHRFKKLLPSLFVATVCYLLVQSLLSGKNAFFSITELAYGNPPLPTSWFVFAVCFFYLIFYLAAKTSPPKCHHQIIIFCLWTACGLYAFILHSIQWEDCWYKSIFSLGIGVTYANYEKNLKNWIMKYPQRLAYILILCFLFLCFVRLVNENLIYTNISAWKLFAYSLTPLFVVFFVYALGSFRSSILDFFGKISYEVYLVQGAFVLWLSIMKNNWGAYFFLTFILTFVSAWLLNRLWNATPFH